MDSFLPRDSRMRSKKENVTGPTLESRRSAFGGTILLKV